MSSWRALALTLSLAALPLSRAGLELPKARPGLSLTRRALVGSAVLLPAAAARSEVRYAPARYTLVPQGNVRNKERRLEEVKRDLVGKPEDPYLLGENAQLEYDLERLRENAAGMGRLRECAASGGSYASRLTIRVPNLEAARLFWVDGLKMSELREARVGPDRARSLVLGYGRESLVDGDDGGKFAIELVEASPLAPAPAALAAGSTAVAGALLYVQLRVPNVRISGLINTGGQIESAYGYVDVVAPHGLPVRVITAPRRDPFQFVAVRVADVNKAAAYYERAFGMRRVNAAAKRMARDGGLLGSGLFAEEYEVQEDVLAPKVVYGSALMLPNCCPDGDAPGVLLVPMGNDSVPAGLRPVGGEGDPIISIVSGAATAAGAAGADAQGFARDPSGTRLQIRQFVA
jgi:catechol 2,3-dioxygenase-like lactoylglutathione lyase family enzyme